MRLESSYMLSDHPQSWWSCARSEQTSCDPVLRYILSGLLLAAPRCTAEQVGGACDKALHSMYACLPNSSYQILEDADWYGLQLQEGEFVKGFVQDLLKQLGKGNSSLPQQIIQLGMQGMILLFSSLFCNAHGNFTS